MAEKMVKCRSCGRVIDADVQFCPHCGAFNKSAFRQDPNKNYCVFCGSELEDGASVCPICGTSVASGHYAEEDPSSGSYKNAFVPADEKALEKAFDKVHALGTVNADNLKKAYLDIVSEPDYSDDDIRLYIEERELEEITKAARRIRENAPEVPNAAEEALTDAADAFAEGGAFDDAAGFDGTAELTEANEALTEEAADAFARWNT